MAYNGTSTATSNFEKQLTDLIQKRMEEELRPVLPWLEKGNYREATFVEGTNNTMRFLRMADLAISAGTYDSTPDAGTAPWLTEGVAPVAEALTFGYEEFSAYQAGRRVEVSDKSLKQAGQKLLSEASEKVSLNGVQTADAFVGYIVNAGTNVLYAGTGNTARTDVAAGDVLTASTLRRTNRSMKRDLIPTFSDGTYRAIIEPGVVFDIEEDASVGGWLDAARYAGGEKLLSGEIGKFAGIRFMESTRASVFAAGGAGSIDVYSTFVFGPEAYAFGDWGTITGHFVAPGGHGDELSQVASVGWKGYFGAMLLDEAGPRYLRIESASDL